MHVVFVGTKETMVQTIEAPPVKLEIDVETTAINVCDIAKCTTFAKAMGRVKDVPTPARSRKPWAA